MKKTGDNKIKSKQGLYFVLWLSFSLFSIVVVLIFAVVQIAVLNSHFRQSTVNKIQTAGNALSESIAATADEEGAVKSIVEINTRYGVSGYLITLDGKSMFPNLTRQKSYPALSEALRKEITGDKASVILSYDNSLVYAVAARYNGQECYLCVQTPLESLTDLENDMGLTSFTMVLVAIILALLVSGFVAAFFSRPVNEVAERAKQLAQGDYSLAVKRSYFCREFNELSEALDYARVEIEKAQKMQEELIANVSHDFKTPLTMIKAYASMIREISDDNKARRTAHAKIIEDESDRLAALVNDLLDLSKIRSGYGEDERGVFNLSEMVYRVVERFDYLKETEGYQIIAEIKDDLYIRANRARIEQVLYNLIGNAANYTGEDKKVAMRLFNKGADIRFEVKDTGSGISEEEIPKIWYRYYRTREMLKRPVKGTGFGLSIVKEILDAHGYPFGVVSSKGHGSTFWIEFSPAPEEEPEGPAAQEEGKPLQKTKKGKSMISSGESHEA